jgi:hypothetical protein
MQIRVVFERLSGRTPYLYESATVPRTHEYLALPSQNSHPHLNYYLVNQVVHSPTNEVASVELQVSAVRS